MLKALIWREISESKKSFWHVAIYSVTFLLFPHFMSIWMIFNELSNTLSESVDSFDALKNFYIINQMFFIAPMILPFASMFFISKIYSERIGQTIAVLMALQIKPQTIWKAKVLVAGCLSGIIYILSVVVYMVVIGIWFDLQITFTINSAVSTFIVSPIIGLTMTVIVSLLYWVIKNPAIISIAVPLISLCGVWFLSERLQNMNITPMAMIFILLISCAILLVCLKIIEKIPNEYIANL